MTHWVPGTTQIDLNPLVIGLNPEKSRREGSVLILAGSGGVIEKNNFFNFFLAKKNIFFQTFRDCPGNLPDEVNVNGDVPRRSGGCLGEFQTPEMIRL